MQVEQKQDFVYLRDGRQLFPGACVLRCTAPNKIEVISVFVAADSYFEAQGKVRAMADEMVAQMPEFVCEVLSASVNKGAKLLEPGNSTWTYDGKS